MQLDGQTRSAHRCGLYYVRSRYYDPHTRRFISEDPIGLAGGINPFVFLSNDPVNRRDPFGLQERFYELDPITVEVDPIIHEYPCLTGFVDEYGVCNLPDPGAGGWYDGGGGGGGGGGGAGGSGTSSSSSYSSSESQPMRVKDRGACGRAVDISRIGSGTTVIDVGQGHRANPAAAGLVRQVQIAALQEPGVRENFGPFGAYKNFADGRGQILRANSSYSANPTAAAVFLSHQNHVHIGLHRVP